MRGVENFRKTDGARGIIGKLTEEIPYFPTHLHRAQFTAYLGRKLAQARRESPGANPFDTFVSWAGGADRTARKLKHVGLTSDKIEQAKLLYENDLKKPA